MDIGTKIREARIAAQLTQEHVAETLSVSRQTMSNWENGKTYPDIINTIKLSDLYKVSLDELLKGDSKMLQYLEESTNTVKSNHRLSIISIAVATVIAAIVTAVILHIGDYGSSILWIALFGEFVLLCVADFSFAKGVSRSLQIISRVLMILFVLIYVCIFVLCVIVALDAFRSGNTSTGIELLVSAVLVAVCVYVLFIRKIIRKLLKRE